MGWDVVEIGLRHDLPVHDPFATAKEVAMRMKKNIRLVYRNEYEYDIANNVVSSAKGPDLIELGKYEANNSSDYLQMIASDYQANKILESAGMNKLRKATFADKFAELILDDLEELFELYELEDRNENLLIYIFNENITLSVSVIERWRTWEAAFYQSEEKWRKWLRDYRMKIYNQAKLFGCNEVIICADQGPGMWIYDNANFLADKLKEYARSYQYLQESTWIEESEKKDWKKHAKHVLFSSVFNNQLTLSDGDWVEVIYDDFSDIGNSREQ